VTRAGLPSLILPVSLVLLISACAPRSQTVSLPPPPAVDARNEGVEDLAEARSHARSGEGLLTDGDDDAAVAEFREAMRLLERYLDQQPRTADAVASELDDLRGRVDSLGHPPPKQGGNESEADVAVNTPEVDGLRIDWTAEVLSRLEYFTEGTGRSTIEVGLDRLGVYEEMIRRVFAEEGVPAGLIYLAQAESAFKPEAVSRSAARGMWQFIPARGEEYGLRQNWWIDERSDPEKSTRAAARHLRDLFERFGDWYLAMAAYNSGPGRVDDAIERTGSRDFWTLAEAGPLPPETRNYIPTILAMAIIGSDPPAFGFDVAARESPTLVRVGVEQATDLRVIAERIGLPLEDIQELNPHILRWATPPDDPDFELVLPTAYAGAFETQVVPLPEEERILFRHHLVASGETLSYIARVNEVPVSVVAEANGLTNPDAIRIGQSLMIPISGTKLPTSLAQGLGTSDTPETRIPPESYMVRRGDTLSALATRFGLQVNDIQAWNSLDSSLLIAGQTLSLVAPRSAPGDSDPVPVPGTAAATEGSIIYSVQPGDTLSRIAAVYRTSVRELQEWNLNSDLSVIYPGDRIAIRSPAPLR